MHSHSEHDAPASRSPPGSPDGGTERVRMPQLGQMAQLMAAPDPATAALPAALVGNFPNLVRDVCLRGDLVLPPLQAHQRPALAALAATYGAACVVVFDGDGVGHLRCGLANPHTPEMVAAELRRLYDSRDAGSRRDGEPLVLRWEFTDRVQHREVVTLLQLLALDMGVFPGRPLFDGVYMYRLEVALEYLPRWEVERQRIIDPALWGSEDPFPVNALPSHRTVRDIYRRQVRPFLYEWNCWVTRCVVDLRRDSDRTTPAEARAIGTHCALRHEVTTAGKIFFRRWTRHQVQVFCKYAAQLKRQDAYAVESTMARQDGKMDAATAEEKTPHFGFFSYSIEDRYFWRDLDELEALARNTGYFVHAMLDKGVVLVMAAARERPAMPPGYTMMFNNAGEYVGPSGRRGFPSQPEMRAADPPDYPFGAERGGGHRRGAEGLPDEGLGSSGYAPPMSRRQQQQQQQQQLLPAAGEAAGTERRLPSIHSTIAAAVATRPVWRPSLAASSLYDTVVGAEQRGLPPGWCVRRSHDGAVCFVDHLRGRAFRAHAPTVATEWNASLRELYKAAESLN